MEAEQNPGRRGRQTCLRSLLPQRAMRVDEIGAGSVVEVQHGSPSDTVVGRIRRRANAPRWLLYLPVG